MEAIKLGKTYFENEEWEKAFDFFSDLRATGYKEQILFPYLMYVTLKTEHFYNVDALITYPFKKQLITDINSFASVLTLEQWQEIENIITECELLVYNLAELILFYFATEDEEKLEYILDFSPENNEEEFWLNMFIYNCHATYKKHWRFRSYEFPKMYIKGHKEKQMHLNKCTSIYPSYALPYYTESSLATALPNGWIQYFEVIDKAIELNPKYKEAYMLRISWYLDEELYKECLVDCEKIIKLNISEKEKERIHSIMEECENFLDDENNNNETHEIMDSKNEIFIAKLIDQADEKIEAGDLKGAVDEFKQILLIDPMSVTANCNLGIVKLMLEDYEDALKYLTKAIVSSPNNLLAYENRAIVRENLNDIEGAINDYSNIIRIDPTSAQAFLNRSNLYMGLERWADSISDLNEILKMSPEPSAYFNRGVAKDNLKDYAGAIADFTKVLNTDNNDIDALYNRGVSKGKIKDFRGAIDDFNKLIELNPEESGAYLERGLIRVIMGDRDAGCRDFSKAGELGEAYAYEMINKYCN